jgi:hypothetical protein
MKGGQRLLYEFKDVAYLPGWMLKKALHVWY